MLSRYLRTSNSNSNQYLGSGSAAFTSVVFGPLLLYPVDHAILKSFGTFGKVGMMGVVWLMNYIMLAELFIFSCMLFKFINNCIQKRCIDFNSLEGEDRRDTIIRVVIAFFAQFAFVGTAALLSYTKLHTPILLICAFFAGMIIISLYYIPHHYKKTYKDQTPLKIVLRHSLGICALLSMGVISIAFACIGASPPKSWVGAIALTIVGLFAALIVGGKINTRFDAEDSEYYEAKAWQIGMNRMT